LILKVRAGSETLPFAGYTTTQMAGDAADPTATADDPQAQQPGPAEPAAGQSQVQQPDPALAQPLDVSDTSPQSDPFIGETGYGTQRNGQPGKFATWARSGDQVVPAEPGSDAAEMLCVGNLQPKPPHPWRDYSFMDDGSMDALESVYHSCAPFCCCLPSSAVIFLTLCLSISFWRHCCC
jgi:hypothetical protein